MPEVCYVFYFCFSFNFNKLVEHCSECYEWVCDGNGFLLIMLGMGMAFLKGFFLGIKLCFLLWNIGRVLWLSV